MKRVFNFKKGQNWDGDEEIISFIEDKLLVYDHHMNLPEVKKDTKITVIIAIKRN